MDAHAAQQHVARPPAFAVSVAGPSASCSPPLPAVQPRRASTISADAVSPRRSSRYLYNASSSPPSTPPPIRKRTKKRRERGRDRDKRPLRPYASEDAISKRHSHGLSWSSNTRDSVVDNLLFSLDNLSRADVDAPADDPLDFAFDKAKYMFPDDIAPPIPTSRIALRARRHTQSSSLSTDYEMPDTPPRMSFSVRGRRSNSSSKFRRTSTINHRISISKQSIDGRASIDSHKASKTILLGGGSAITRQSSERGRADTHYDTLADKTKSRLKRRSMSVDHLFSDAIMSPGASMLDRGRPVPSTLSTFDAGYEVAPEPLVAGGPRRKDNPTATGPVFVNLAQQRSTLRKITTQTDLRSANSQDPLSPSIPDAVRSQASNFVRMSSMQSRPTTQGQSKGQSNLPKYTTPTIPGQKERPGFFRRMFGGSSTRSSSTIAQPETMAFTPHNNDTQVPTARGSTSTSSPGRIGTRHSSREGEISNAPTLSKKPSSLFRRRKKSLAEAPPPPPLPAAFSGLKVATVEPSPLKESFRKAMNPYLIEDEKFAQAPSTDKYDDLSRPSTAGSVTESSDSPGISHSGYQQQQDAPLAARARSLSIKADQSVEKEASPKGKLKVKKRKPEPELAPMDTSFLLDPSIRELSTTPTASSEHISPIADSAAKETKLPRPTSKTSIGEKYLTAGASSIEAWVAHEQGVPSPASRASSGDRTFRSSTGNGDARWERRKESVVSSVSSGRGEDTWVRPNTQDHLVSKTSERLVLKPSVEQMLFYSGQSESSILPGLQEADSRKSSTYQTATSPALPSSINSPLSPQSQYHSATSLPLPDVREAGDEPVKISAELVDEGAEFRERARKIFEGDEEDVMKSEAAAWLGETNTLSTRTLAAYLQLFNFTGVTILAALRSLCNKLTLRGETQQFDRIITALSARWCECNPNHGFKAQDVVHTIVYSLILLNTDLHLADIEGKMSRSAYVKNTLPTIRRVVADAAPNAFDDTIRPMHTATRPTVPWNLSNTSVPQTPVTPNQPTSERPSLEQDRPATISKRQSFRPAISRHDSDNADAAAASGAGSIALVSQPWTGSMRAWESEIESVLKSFFLAIKIEPLPLHGAALMDVAGAERNLSTPNFTNMRRSNSVASKTASDNASFRSKPGLRSVTSGLQNKYNLSRSKLYPSSTLSSSKTSFDDGGSVWSPAQSTWSKYSFSKTLTSASMQSLGQHFVPAADFKHSIGFANALSQAIIREEQAVMDNDSGSISVTGALLDEEALTLEGAPWAKEGLVKHKHHLETPGKKAKERNWTDCFAVISKGKLTLFAFNTSTKSASVGRKALNKSQGSNGRAASVGGQKVGGGDWMENAEQLDSFILRQTIASTLPPPGYSKNRPHVWALNLPTGAVHLFQVGTLEIAKEFMSTANYWSARLSKEPLSGGVSNVEYGWSDAVINAALVEPRPMSPPVAAAPGGHGLPMAMQNRQIGYNSQHKHSTSASAMSMQSMTSSLRTSLDTGFGGPKTRLPGDRAHLADWQPPTQSLMASQLMEVDQLKALTAYVGHVEMELARHNELKGPIELAFSPRHANYTRAMANWQRKSEHLLRENVKFQTYVDSLTVAQQAREKFYARKSAEILAGGGVRAEEEGGADAVKEVALLGEH